MKDKPHKFGYKLLCCAVIMGFAHKTEISCGQNDDPKFWKNEEPDIGASGSFVI